MVEFLEGRTLLSAAPPVFNTPQVYQPAGGLGAVAVADVNRDGQPDVVGTGVALLGKGDGTFRPGSTFAEVAGSNHVLTADLNGDGCVDLVMDGGESYPAFFIVMGNGDGTFKPPQTVGALAHDDSIAVADINGDGHADLLGGSGRGFGLQVLPGNGNGTFKPQYSLFVGTAPYGLVVADLNGDGKADVATTDSQAQVSVLLGNGDGTFAPRRTLPNILLQTALAAGDVNNDGRVDLVTSCYPDGSLQVYLGNGDGSFQAPWTFGGIGHNTFNLTLADANGDGKLDVLRGAGAVYVCLGNGDGSFSAKNISGQGLGGWSTVFADLNRDGRLDAVSGPSQVYVALGDPPPTALSIVSPAVGPFTSNPSIDYTVTFSEPVTGVDPTDFQVPTTGVVTASPTVAVTGGPTVYTVIVSGITGTGTPSGPDGLGRVGLDLIDDGTIHDSVGQSLQRRGVTTWKTPVTPSTGAAGSIVVAADLNGDGNPDIAEAAYTSASNVLNIFLGNGDRSFKPPSTFAAGSFPTSLVPADFDRDGRIDLAIYSGSLGIYFGNGDGTFKAVRTLDAFSLQALAAADVNGDGITDLVGAPQTRVAVLLGNGNGTFKPQATFAVGQSNDTVAVSDVNGDGRADIVVAGQSDTGVNVLLGNGNGTFHAPVTSATPITVRSIAVADLDSDGRPDVIITHPAGGLVVMHGNGDGTFAPAASYSVPVTERVFPVVDLNSDGILDLPVPGLSSLGSGLLLGNGDGTFRTENLPVTTAYAFSEAAADFDHNGLPDLVFPNENFTATTMTVLPASADAGITGQTFAIVPNVNVLTDHAGFGVFYLQHDVDGVHIDEIGLDGAPLGQTRTDDPLGLTINGSSLPDTVELSFANGSPLPKVLRLNGTFDVPLDSPPADNFLGGATLDIGQSVITLYLGDADSPLASLKAALARGYNGGAWNGAPSGLAGSIVSAEAAAGPAGLLGIGIATSSDGVVPNLPLNSIQLRYTLMGDSNLDGVADIFDLNALLPHYNSTGDWTSGDFTYDGKVEIFDLNTLLPNYNQSITPARAAAASPATADDKLLAAAAVKAADQSCVPFNTEIRHSKGSQKLRSSRLLRN